MDLLKSPLYSKYVESNADIVELSPEIDKSGVSSIVAAKVLRSLILSLDNMQ